VPPRVHLPGVKEGRPLSDVSRCQEALRAPGRETSVTPYTGLSELMQQAEF